jgi:hypothetical protein
MSSEKKIFSKEGFNTTNDNSASENSYHLDKLLPQECHLLNSLKIAKSNAFSMEGSPHSIAVSGESWQPVCGYRNPHGTGSHHRGTS